MPGSCCDKDDTIALGWCLQPANRAHPQFNAACTPSNSSYGMTNWYVDNAGGLREAGRGTFSETENEAGFCEVLGKVRACARALCAWRCRLAKRQRHRIASKLGCNSMTWGSGCRESTVKACHPQQRLRYLTFHESVPEGMGIDALRRVACLWCATWCRSSACGCVTRSPRSPRP